MTLGALWPPRFLQAIILFTGAGLGCTFLAPTVLALYWRRTTRAGALAALWGGFGSVFLLYVLGWNNIGKAGLSGALADPFARPAIKPNYLTTHTDELALLAGTRHARRIFASPALAVSKAIFQACGTGFPRA